ncbi:MAG: hypothetical protein HQL56_03010 [Magnetococcales bacterium]|nr:hypothetical protein [Magnetococcales bacterium]
MGKTNCWEFMHCGREPGGAKVRESGICPAAAYRQSDGFNGGRNGGRACLFIKGTFCGTSAKSGSKEGCPDCPFYRKELAKDGIDFMSFMRFVMGSSGKGIGVQSGGKSDFSLYDTRETYPWDNAVHH